MTFASSLLGFKMFEKPSSARTHRGLHHETMVREVVWGSRCFWSGWTSMTFSFTSVLYEYTLIVLDTNFPLWLMDDDDDADIFFNFF